jgi:hypothetical protein
MGTGLSAVGRCWQRFWVWGFRAKALGERPRTKHRICVALMLGTVALATVSTGCSSAGDDKTKSQVGTLNMSLVGEANGVTYRLRNAMFVVNGPEDTVLNSEDDPNAATIAAELDSGDYSIDLQDGWVLERLDGTAFVQVDSLLVSPDPTTFHISANVPTSVTYQFSTNGVIVSIGKGTLNVGISVVQNSTGCSSDTDCGGAVASCQSGQCVNTLTKFSEGSQQWPDDACNPTTSFGVCDTNDQTHADAWASAVCQNNGWASGVWTGYKIAGCSGDVSMWCQGQIPCAQLLELTCQPSDQTIVEFTCLR